ncbi:hypothetical protein ACFV6J_35045, partial [Kitasatospora sp. NPDC059800]
MGRPGGGQVQLELLAERGPLGPVWWRYGRPGRHYLTEALDNPDNRAAYDRRQAARDGGEQFGGGRVLLGGRSRVCRRAAHPGGPLADRDRWQPREGAPAPSPGSFRAARPAARRGT